MSSVTVPPELLGVLLAPPVEDGEELDELPHAARTTTDATAARLARTGLSCLLKASSSWTLKFVPAQPGYLPAASQLETHR
jgi:hypothetical protein